MNTQRMRDEDGWVLVTVMAMLVITLGIGLAMLAVVDTQTAQSRETRLKDASFALAEGAMTGTTSELDQTWPSTAVGTPRCTTIDRPLAGPIATPPATASLDDRIAAQVRNAFGSDPTYVGGEGSSWRVDICRVTSASERWDATAFLTDARTNVAWDASRMWIRATSRTRVGTRTVGAVTSEANPLRKRTVVTQVRRTTSTDSSTTYENTRLPDDFAILTGRLSTELGGALSTLSSGQLLQLTRGLLGTNPLIQNTTAKLGVRCALLKLLDDGNLCLSGTLAGLGSTVGALDPLSLGDPLNGLLGTNRTVQAPTWSVTNDEELAAYVSMAKNDATNGVYRASVDAGSNCLPSNSAGKVVVIEQVVTKTAAAPDQNKCKVSLTSGATSRAKALIVLNGGVLVEGTGSVSTTRTFEGIIMAANGGTTPARAGKTELVAIRKGGSVNGAVYVDGDGGVGIYPPDLTLAQLLGPVGGLCTLPIVGNICGTVDALLTVVGGVTGLQPTLNQLLGGYTAVTRDLTVINAAKIPTPYTGTVTTHRTVPVPGSFLQTSSN